MRHRGVRSPVLASLLAMLGLAVLIPAPIARAAETPTYFLRTAGGDQLVSNVPTGARGAFKDAPPLNRVTFRAVGTWTGTPEATSLHLAGPGEVCVWLGLKNSDDQGTAFDVRAELLVNGVVIATGEAKNVVGVTRDPRRAKQVAIALTPFTPTPVGAGDVLALRILAKVADRGGHSHAVGVRLYYDAADRRARVQAMLGPAAALLDVRVDESRKVSQNVGASGGTVETTGADGTRYALAIPAGALAAGQLISLTPILSVDNLPLTGGLIAAVAFAPEGLQFANPATVTITVSPSAALARAVGFSSDGAGGNFHVIPVGVNGLALTLAVPHFSNAGAAAATSANLESQVQSLLNALPASVPLSQIDNIMEVAGLWEATFPGACSASPVCNQLLALANTSLLNHEAQVCALGQSFLSQGAPFLAEQTVKPLIHVNGLLQVLGDPGQSIACATAIVSGAIGQAGAMALADPKLSLLEFLLVLEGDAATLGDSALVDAARGHLKAALDKVLALGVQLCQNDPAIGVEVLERRCVVSDAQLVGLADQAFLDLFVEAFRQCGLQIEPATITLAPSAQQQFNEVLYGTLPTPVTWAVVSGPGTIDANGMLIADASPGIVKVTATSSTVKPFTPVCMDPLLPPNPSPFISFPQKVASATVTVQGVAVTPAASGVPAGGQVQFTAVVTGLTNTAVTWSATGGSITAAGLFTAAGTPGSVTVTATSVADPTRTGTASVTVTPAPAVVTVTSRYSRVSFSVGAISRASEQEPYASDTHQDARETLDLATFTEDIGDEATSNSASASGRAWQSSTVGPLSFTASGGVEGSATPYVLGLEAASFAGSSDFQVLFTVSGGPVAFTISGNVTLNQQVPPGDGGALLRVVFGTGTDEFRRSAQTWNPTIASGPTQGVLQPGTYRLQATAQGDQTSGSLNASFTVTLSLAPVHP